MQKNQLYHSTKNNTTYAIISIGENLVYQDWKKTPKGWVRNPRLINCTAQQAILQEIKEWGKPIVVNTADFQAAIQAGTITQVNS